MKTQSIKLIDCVEYIRGITFKPEDKVENFSNDAIVCMRTKNIQEFLDESDLISVPSRFVRRDELFLKEGDVLISSANSWELVGKCCYVSKLKYKATAGGFISIVRPNKEKIDSRFLYHWLTSDVIQNTIRNMGRQTTNISNLEVKAFTNLSIIAPPLPEQHRIAAILDKADGIRRKRQEALKLADEFLRSVFLDMFGDPVTNPKGWEIKPIEKAGRVVTGNTPPRNVPEYYGSDVEWIKSDNINTPSHYLTRSSEFLSLKGKEVARTVPSGSILVTCIAGSPDCIGNSAITDREVAFNQQINAFVPNEEFDTEFMYTQFLVGKKLIQRTSTNAMKGMVSKGAFEKINVIMPPSNLRKSFRERFRSMVNAETRLLAAKKYDDDLFNALVQRAFRGEL